MHSAAAAACQRHPAHWPHLESLHAPGENTPHLWTQSRLDSSAFVDVQSHPLDAEKFSEHRYGGGYLWRSTSPNFRESHAISCSRPTPSSLPWPIPGSTFSHPYGLSAHPLHTLEKKPRPPFLSLLPAGHDVLCGSPLRPSWATMATTHPVSTFRLPLSPLPFRPTLALRALYPCQVPSPAKSARRDTSAGAR